MKKLKVSNTVFGKLRILIMLFLITWLVSLSVYSNPFSYKIAGHDSSMFQYFGYAMSRGEALYVDIFDHKGPVIFLLNYLGEIFSTNNIQGIWILEFFSLFSFFLWTYKTARFWNNRIISFIPVIIFAVSLPSLLEGGNLTEEFALPFMGYSVYVFVKYFINDYSIELHEVVFLGGSFGISFLLRPNMIGIWVVFSGYIFFLLLLKRELNDLFRFVLSFIGGILLIVIPIMFYLINIGALRQAFFQTWSFNIMYLDNSQIDHLRNMSILMEIFNRYGFIFIFSGYLGIIIFHWKIWKTEQRILHSLSVSSVILSAFFTFMSGRTYQHYMMILLPVMIIPISYLFLYFTLNFTQKSIASFVVILLVVLGLSTPIYNNYVLGMSLNTNIIGNSDRLNDIEKRIISYAEEKNKISNISQWIKNNSLSSDRIYVHRLAGNIYLESERLSSIKYFNLPAINLNENIEIGEDFVNEFINSETEVVVVKDTFADYPKTVAEEHFFQFVLSNYYEEYRAEGFVGFIKK